MLSVRPQKERAAVSSPAKNVGERDTALHIRLDERASAGEGAMKVNIDGMRGIELLFQTLDVSLDDFDAHVLKVNFSCASGEFLLHSRSTSFFAMNRREY